MGWPPKIQNYLLEGGPLVDRLPQLGGCSRNPSVSLWQLALLWEAVLGFSDSFLKTQHMCPFHDGWLPRAPAHTLLSVQQFLPKMARPQAPPSLFTQSFLPETPGNLVSVSQDEKGPPRETFCQCGRGKTKKGRSTKRHQNQQVKNCFEQWEKCLCKCIDCIKWRVLWRWLKFKHVRINTQI